MESAYFVVTRRRKACLLAPPQHGGARFPTLTPLGPSWPLRACASSPNAGENDQRDCLSDSYVNGVSNADLTVGENVGA